MSERKVNLEEILEKHRQMFIKNSVKHPDYIIDAMKEACRQTLELAAENAFAEEGVIGYSWEVNQESILNTIKQVE